MIHIELHRRVVELLKSRFNILYACNCREFDTQPAVLEAVLQAYQNRHFDLRDKILLVHMDTDYYDALLPCGLIPINVVRAFRNSDIPMHALLFVSNHFGIQKEFDLLLSEQHPKDRPTILQTLLAPKLLPEFFEITDAITFDQIEKPAVCMMNQSRSHRVAFYNFLRHNGLLSQVAVSQNFNA